MDGKTDFACGRITHEIGFAEFAPPAVLLTVTAEKGAKQLLEFLGIILAHPMFKLGMGILIDKSMVRMPPASDVRHLVRFIDGREAAGITRGWAFVVADITSYGLGRMAEGLSERQNSIRAFKDFAEAANWLLARPISRPLREPGPHSARADSITFRNSPTLNGFLRKPEI